MTRSCARRVLWALVALPVVVASGCRVSGLSEARVSLPDPGAGSARLVVQIEGQPVPVYFDPVAFDHLEWTEHDVDQAPPNPLSALPAGAGPAAAWLLRARRRGSTALVPLAYLGLGDHQGARQMIYSTRTHTGRLEPGGAFEVAVDGAVRVVSPTAPPPMSAPPPTSGPSAIK